MLGTKRERERGRDEENLYKERTKLHACGGLLLSPCGKNDWMDEVMSCGPTGTRASESLAACENMRSQIS
jgi:hypothetical protein